MWGSIKECNSSRRGRNYKYDQNLGAKVEMKGKIEVIPVERRTKRCKTTSKVVYVKSRPYVIREVDLYNRSTCCLLVSTVHNMSRCQKSSLMIYFFVFTTSQITPPYSHLNACTLNTSEWRNNSVLRWTSE